MTFCGLRIATDVPSGIRHRAEPEDFEARYVTIPLRINYLISAPGTDDAEIEYGTRSCPADAQQDHLVGC
jgi:hypothetical protein